MPPGGNDSYHWGKRRLRTISSSLTQVVCTSILLFSGRENAQYNVSAQELGVTICACSPRYYQFTLDFALSCDTNVILGEGVASYECSIEPFQGSAIADLIPVSVSSIDLIELDQGLNLLSQASSFGPFLNGNTSVTNNLTYFNETTGGDTSLVPKALQFSVLGQNAAGESIFFTGLIVYNNSCSVVNTILVNSTIGWFRLVSKNCRIQVTFRILSLAV
jgi:hypothetical protein